MGTYLTNTVCENCDDDAKFNLISSAGGLGWFGGCGSMVCTGMRNLLVYDKDGKFLGKKGIVIGDNREFGDVFFNNQLYYYRIYPNVREMMFGMVTCAILKILQT